MQKGKNYICTDSHFVARTAPLELPLSRPPVLSHTTFSRRASPLHPPLDLMTTNKTQDELEDPRGRLMHDPPETRANNWICKSLPVWQLF